MSKPGIRERIRLDEIRYLALEGGGGKGTCYLGALRLLSDRCLYPPGVEPLLPLSSASPLRGLSGASAGSIVTYMLAIGMTVKQIDDEMTSTVTYDPAAPEPIKPSGTTPVFNTFFEPPQPGVRKGVYHEAGRNVSGYAVDQLKAARSKELADGADLVKKIFPLVISETKSARYFRAYHEALRAGRTNQLLQTAAYPILKVVLGEAAKLVKDRKLRLLDDEGIEGLIKQRKLWPGLAASLLFDRGVLSGNAVREYVRYLTRKYLKPSHFAGRSRGHRFTDALIAKLDPSTLTFRDLYQITGCKLVLMGTNITNKLSLPFSAEATPDFPLVDAVGLSMSIPGLFKPTFVSGEVKLDRGEDTAAHNYRYKGFFVDGGMLVNIPMHAFDYEADNPNPGMLHERLLGLGLADGVDRNENPGFQSDPDYQAYRRDAQDKLTRRGQTAKERQEALKEQQKADAAINTYLKLPDRQRNGLPNMSATRDRRSFSLAPGGYSYTIHPAGRLLAPFAILSDLLGSLLGTLTDYAPEAGQFRTPAERQRYVPLDAYDITITTFTPHEKLTRFVNVRSFNKLYWYFFRHAPTRELLQKHFGGDYAPPRVGLPCYDGAKSPTND